MNEVTQLLEAVEQGQQEAAARLLPIVYEELRRLASQKLAQEKPGQTLQPTALVHEAYLRLIGSPNKEDLSHEDQRGGSPPVETNRFSNRRYFFAAAVEAMRRILIDNARRKQSEKHGGAIKRHDVLDVDLIAQEPREDLLALDEALQKLKQTDPQTAELVQLRYFAGLSIPESADVLAIAPRTADRLWAYAKAFLHQELQKGE